MNQPIDTQRMTAFATLKSRVIFNLALPIAMILLLIFGWSSVFRQMETITTTAIAAYQRSELEIVRVAARSIRHYVEEQVTYHHLHDQIQIEQEIFNLFIEPIRVLENGDAWIYAPDHVVFDLSEDFPDAYRGKSMAQIFEIQKKHGASHYEAMSDAVMNSREGVGWYIWLPEKGREIAAWTPVNIGDYTWTIGLSVPLPELLEATGVTRQIRTSQIYLVIVTLAFIIILLAWGYGAWQKEQMTQALQRSQLTLRTVLDTIPQAICWKDQRFSFLGSNRNFNRLAGVEDPGDLIGSPETDTDWQSLELESFGDLDQQILNGKEPVLHQQFSIHDISGKEIWLDTNRVPLIDSQGKIFGLMTTYEDVTERREKALEIAQLRDYLSHIVNSMPSILVGVDLDGKINQWNAEAEKVTFLSANEAVGRELKTVFPELAEGIKTSFQDDLVNEPMTYERVRSERSGSVKYWDTTVYPLKSDTIQGFVIRIDDVTDRVRVDDMMIQTEKMASVGGLAAGVAHEINNPLAGILQNAQVLSKRISKELSINQKIAAECGTTIEVIMEYMDKRDIPKICGNVLEGSRRASHIVNNMLSFSRKSALQPYLLDIRELADSALELASNDFDLKTHSDFNQIQIRKEYDPDMPRVMCEKTEIQQVLLNLIKNAAQALSSERIENPELTIRIYAKEGMAGIEIEDNGPGMSESVRKRVFEPFFTTKDVGRGVGLGMSVSYFIITENHEGTFTVESAPGEGARFIIQLPIIAKSA